MRRSPLAVDLAAALLLPASASAGTVTARTDRFLASDSQTFLERPLYGFRADAGERNALRVTARADGTIRVEDDVALRSPAECRSVDPLTVDCPGSVDGGERTQVFEADLGDGDDSVALSGESFIGPTLLADGGEGDDVLTAPRGGGKLKGGPGADDLRGGPTGATLDGGPGPDRLDPGTGRARLSYGGRTDGVRVDLAGDGAAGEAGEGDVVLPGFTGVGGGAGPDVLRAGEEGAALFGGAGDDVLEGGPGADGLEGGPGADTVRGGAGDDRLTNGGLPDEGPDTLEGGSGDDELTGSSGPDLLDGGPGDDDLRGLRGDDRLTGGPGRDELFGFEGVDHLDARDGDADSVMCEPPGFPDRVLRLDTARLDPRDHQSRCGTIDRSGSPRAELVALRPPRRRGRRGRARAVLFCPARAVVCRGTLSTSAPSQPAVRRSFAIRPGRETTVGAPYVLRGDVSVEVEVRLLARDARGRAFRDAGFVVVGSFG